MKPLCQVVEIARSSFSAWVTAAPGRAVRAAADAALAEQIRVLQDPARRGDRAYGAPRIIDDLKDGVASTERVNRNRVARVKWKHRIAGIRLRRRVTTTIPDQSGCRFPDLIGRDFSVGEPNRRYVGDITYLPIEDGSTLSLAPVIDLGSRKLAGWAMADHMRTDLLEDTLNAATRERGSLAGAIFHSTLRRELLQRRATIPDQSTAYRVVFRWANRYNTRRRHSTIGNIRANAYETATSTTLAKAA